MKYVIDTEILDKEDIALDEVLYLISLYKKKRIDFHTVQNSLSKDVIAKSNDSKDPITITAKGKVIVERILTKSKLHVSQTNLDRYLSLAVKLKELYPKGLKPGTNSQWRDSTGIIADRLLKLVTKYNVEFTDEEAIDATKRYIASFNGNYTYMQILKYFISKQYPVAGAPAEQNSQFLSFLENKEEGNTVSQDWTANLV